MRLACFSQVQAKSSGMLLDFAVAAWRKHGQEAVTSCAIELRKEDKLLAV
jgi:hypothetical protein